MQNLIEEYGGTIIIAILFSGVIIALNNLFEIISLGIS